jgi:starvation-inducible DNA-binding protein
MEASRNNEFSIEVLSTLLANTHVVMLKTLRLHWNMVGNGFVAVRKITCEQAAELFNAMDEIAERIRTIGGTPPATSEKLLEAASVSSDVTPRSDLDEVSSMITDLISSHQAICNEIKCAYESVSKTDDCVTSNLLSDRLSYHEKLYWMWGAMIAKPRMSGTCPLSA